MSKARTEAAGAWSARVTVTWLPCLIAAIAAFGLSGSISAGSASAYTREWRCKPANGAWCYDPNGLADWQTGKVKLEKGYNAYLCVGVFKESWGADFCSSNRLPVGGYVEWKFGTAFSAHNPLHGAGLQENEFGNAQEIWNWFYEP